MSSNFIIDKFLALSKPVKGLSDFKKNAPLPSLYDFPEVYEMVYPGHKGDKVYYSNVTTKGKCLYLGIGTGRIFSEICKNNPYAFGLDNSKRMVKKMLLRNPHISEKKIIFANVLSANIQKNSFDKIIAPFSFLTQFDPSGVKQILDNVHRWLKPKGVFYTDLFSPFFNPPVGHNYEIKKYRIGKEISVVQKLFYNFVNQRLLEITEVKRNSEEFSVVLPLYFYFPNELVRICNECGFTVESLKGDYSKKDFSENHQTMVICLRKR